MLFSLGLTLSACSIIITNNNNNKPAIKTTISNQGFNQLKVSAAITDISIKYGDKYNVEYFSQTKEWADKSYLTKKKNNSFHTSKVEQQFKEYLEQNYPNDFEYQYRSEMYPFNCDFYIKSLDLYIEIQGSWVHGKHPFDENNQEDIDRLNYMKSKNTKYYQNSIYVWTISDIAKRNVAKQNNLKYLEIFSSELNECINALYNYKNKKEFN